MGEPTESEQLLRSNESADEFYDDEDADNELNYSGSEEEQAGDQDREYEQQERMCSSMGNVDIGSSDDEGVPGVGIPMDFDGSSDEEPTGLAMPSEGDGRINDLGELRDD